jgi:hypothetical protein
MRFNDVQISLEQYIKDNWTATPLAFENVPLNSDLYNQFVQMHVVFGDSIQRSITNCFRVLGLLVLSIYVRPAEGMTAALTTADQLSALLVSTEVVAVPPHTAPVVQLKTPDLHKGSKEEQGWVKVQLSCPFHYDLEI